MNATLQAEPFYTLSNNVLRKIMLEPSYQILNSTGEVFLNSMIEKFYEINSDIHTVKNIFKQRGENNFISNYYTFQHHTLNLVYHSQEYNDFFDEIMKTDPC